MDPEAQSGPDTRLHHSLCNKKTVYKNCLTAEEIDQSTKICTAMPKTRTKVLNNVKYIERGKE